jgi:hypothetical protein
MKLDVNHLQIVVDKMSTRNKKNTWDLDHKYAKEFFKLVDPYIIKAAIKSTYYDDDKEDAIAEVRFQVWRALEKYGPRPKGNKFGTYTLKLKVNNCLTNRFKKKESCKSKINYMTDSLDEIMLLAKEGKRRNDLPSYRNIDPCEFKEMVLERQTKRPKRTYKKMKYKKKDIVMVKQDPKPIKALVKTHKEKRKEYYEKNKEKIKEYSKKYYLRKKEEKLELNNKKILNKKKTSIYMNLKKGTLLDKIRELPKEEKRNICLSLMSDLFGINSEEVINSFFINFTNLISPGLKDLYCINKDTKEENIDMIKTAVQEKNLQIGTKLCSESGVVFELREKLDNGLYKVHVLASGNDVSVPLQYLKKNAFLLEEKMEKKSTRISALASVSNIKDIKISSEFDPKIRIEKKKQKMERKDIKMDNARKARTGTAKALVLKMLREGPKTKEELSKSIIEKGLSKHKDIEKVGNSVSVMISTFRKSMNIEKQEDKKFKLIEE